MQFRDSDYYRRWNEYFTTDPNRILMLYLIDEIDKQLKNRFFDYVDLTPFVEKMKFFENKIDSNLSNWLNYQLVDVNLVIFKSQLERRLDLFHLHFPVTSDLYLQIQNGEGMDDDLKNQRSSTPNSDLKTPNVPETRR